LSQEEAAAPPAAVEASNEESPPTVSEVCENFGLNDVDLDYTEADHQNLTTYKLFQQNYRQRIQAANPKVFTFFMVARKATLFCCRCRNLILHIVALEEACWKKETFFQLIDNLFWSG
jgi:hypothetical protein